MYMNVFAGIIVGSFIIAILAKFLPQRRPGGLRQPQPNFLGFILPAVAFTLFSGYRNNLGDTDLYLHEYSLYDPETMVPVPFRFQGDSMYPFIMTHLRAKYDDPHYLLLITAAISIIPVIYIIYKYCEAYELGIVLFVLTGYYTFSMNGIRQYCAAGILILGAKYLLSEKNKDVLKFIPFVIGAWLFHPSALLMIPVYFVVRRKAWSPFTFLLLIGTVFATLIFDTLLPSFLGVLEDTGYGRYADNGWFTEGTERGSNIIRVFVLSVPLIMAFIAREKLSFLHGKKWDILVNISIINLAFYILSLYNWIFARLAIYTSIYVIIMTTYVIKEAFEAESPIIYGSSLGLYSIYFYFIRYSIMAYRSDFY